MGLFSFIRPRTQATPTGGLLRPESTKVPLATEYHNGVPIYDPTDPLSLQLLQSTRNPNPETPRYAGEAFVPKVVYEPPSETGSGFKSKLAQALIDMKMKGYPDSMNGEFLRKQLGSRGISEQEMIESGVDITALRGTNKVSLENILQTMTPPSDKIKHYQQRGFRDIPYDVSKNDFTLSAVGRDPISLDEYAQLTGEFSDPMDWTRQTLFRPMMDSTNAWAFGDPDVDYIDEAVAQLRNLNQDIPEEHMRSLLFTMANDYGDRLHRNASPEKYDLLERPTMYDQSMGVDPYLPNSMRTTFERFMRENQELDALNNPILNRQYRLYDSEIEALGNDKIGYELYIDGEYFGHHENAERLNMAANDYARGVKKSRFDEEYDYPTKPEHSDYLRGEQKPEEFQNTYLTMDDLDFEGSEHFSDINARQGYIAHSRESARDSSVGPVHHMDELQSDLHKRRDEGYETPEYRQQANEWADRLNSVYADVNKWHDFEFGDKALRDLFNQFPEIYGRRLEIYNDAPKDMINQTVNDYASKLRRDMEKFIEGRESRHDYSQLQDGPLKDFFNDVKADREADSEYREWLMENDAGLPDAPLKGNKWLEALIKRGIMNAIENGKDGVSFGNAMNQERLYFKNLRERIASGERIDPELLKTYNSAINTYETIYEKMIPDMLKKLGKQYGVEPRQIDIKDPQFKQDGKNWYLPITNPMKRLINRRGMNLYGKVKKGLLREPEQKRLQGGLMDGAQYYA